ncbi:hypothetical protein AAA799E16_01311 [Marine Group I thaumarchaeote SCGC AAA799-E16]|uniref:Uncharacterized protein n=5 Tax=Marine Group I TaxID=905826 RepID=A0A087S898_9ARCH|nr:hypothetical protein AAA799N04_01433 [Marine Group I thaumarchaeote SCGC AAA799-N04]KER06010.1 hypothetical protein AAA799E16_01311 [Marine Group I thaumarchaeote SCGC AAA799-E16]KFM15701.1 hypothetical protein SCCGRSA3_02619 [Marine Group I thaumarchaeote SCGC RSA3]KFM18218.1 hypothetical protein AAA799P11_01135 [Marine Group I thaumarchaeote SCGC AAA799-P11]KFM21952.1 hypothetical protein AAA799B03_00394 [Marine Group I thaumarchaeote SCGC AAA799-B03]
MQTKLVSLEATYLAKVATDAALSVIKKKQFLQSKSRQHKD